MNYEDVYAPEAARQRVRSLLYTCEFLLIEYIIIFISAVTGGWFVTHYFEFRAINLLTSIQIIVMAVTGSLILQEAYRRQILIRALTAFENDLSVGYNSTER